MSPFKRCVLRVSQTPFPASYTPSHADRPRSRWNGSMGPGAAFWGGLGPWSNGLKSSKKNKKIDEPAPWRSTVHLRFSSLLREYFWEWQSARSISNSRKRSPNPSLRDGSAVAQGASTGIRKPPSASARPAVRVCSLTWGQHATRAVNMKTTWNQHATRDANMGPT